MSEPHETIERAMKQLSEATPRPARNLRYTDRSFWQEYRCIDVSMYLCIDVSFDRSIYLSMYPSIQLSMHLPSMGGSGSGRWYGDEGGTAPISALHTLGDEKFSEFTCSRVEVEAGGRCGLRAVWTRMSKRREKCVRFVR